MEIGNNAKLAAPTASERQTSTGAQGELNRDAFMRLLVTQLQNQDPLDPMDAQQMVSQLSELTGVEQLVAIEGRLGALEVGMAGVGNTQVAGLVGKTVTADASSLRLGEQGSAQGAFRLDGRADQVNITIRDSQGNEVKKVQLGSHFPGDRTFQWDGTDSTGERMPPGRYRIDIEAVDESGQAVPISTEVSGMVTAVTYEDGFPELMVGNTKVLLGDVESIGL